MEVVQPKKTKKGRIFIRIIAIILIAAFLFYAVFTIIGKNIRMSEQQRELDSLTTELTAQNERNEELKKELDTGVHKSDTFIERAARETLGYAKPGEQIFVNISGN